MSEIKRVSTTIYCECGCRIETSLSRKSKRSYDDPIAMWVITCPECNRGHLITIELES